MGSQTRVKICGLTSVEDAAHASDCGADAVGLVFYDPSPRNISDIAKALDIAQAVGPFVDVVGLFVNAEPRFVEKILSRIPLNILQFHGNEQADFCEQFSRPFLKALRMKPGVNIVEAAAEYSSARGILLDTYVKGTPGGTGKSFNWDDVPPTLTNVVLAGGLESDNVGEAIAAVRPYAVDVSGGVESAPGIKDPYKVKKFIENAKLEY